MSGDVEAGAPAGVVVGQALDGDGDQQGRTAATEAVLRTGGLEAVHGGGGCARAPAAARSRRGALFTRATIETARHRTATIGMLRDLLEADLVRPDADPQAAEALTWLRANPALSAAWPRERMSGDPGPPSTGCWPPESRSRTPGCREPWFIPESGSPGRALRALRALVVPEPTCGASRHVTTRSRAQPTRRGRVKWKPGNRYV
ncbi:hypothetical protein [Streptomyces sp. NRRL F-2747]|uniref:hypothetical protein n=1 Tax=Streptomyces sp. NRRL F-2747 TaxID=1463843 RepID=UPI00131AD0A0|nr:hypothetical protein [Streptomyces sp. NRRL F-2747]